MVTLAATLLSDKGTKPLNWGTSSQTILFAAIAVAAMLLFYFALQYFLDWTLRRTFRSTGSRPLPKSKGPFRYWIEDWQRRRQFHRAWNRKRRNPKQ